MIRRHFPALDQKVHGEKLVYLDSAATTQKPLEVIEAVDSVYRQDCANVHRGVHTLSERATARYEDVRNKVAKFLGTEESREVVFTRGVTEAMNLLANSLGSGDHALVPGDEIVIGRSSEAGIPLESPAISRKHVRITRRKWNWFAEHLGQANPALINKRPFTVQKLMHGDTILIAEHTLVFDYPRAEQIREREVFEGRAGASFKLGAQDIERALDDPDIKPATVYGTEDSNAASSVQLYFGPGWEDRLELEMEE